MNEKFFDLSKEKQDRIMSASMKIFALEGYEHAGTDDIVRLARISKGLLFHYFISKKGLFSFLYDYASRFVQLEFSRNVDSEETDFFTLNNQELYAWQDAMRQYPYIRFFLQRAGKENDAEVTDGIADRKKTFNESKDAIRKRCDCRIFGSSKLMEQAQRMMDLTAEGLFYDLDFDDENWQEKYFSELKSCLELLKKCTDITLENTEVR